MFEHFTAEELYNLFANLFTTPIFRVKETPITIVSIIILVLIIWVVFIVSKITKRVLLKKIFPKAQMEIGTQYTLARLSQYLLMTIGFIFAFQFIGIDLSGLTVIFGLLSVGIGFGLQNLTSNFISGIIVLFERPISIGDRVLINGIEGDVIEINIRSTLIQSLNNVAYIVPNADFVSGTVVNYSHGDKRVKEDIQIGVAYNADVDKVKSILLEIASRNKNILKNPEPEVFLMNFGDSSLDFRLRVWTFDPKHRLEARSEINFEIVHEFRKNAIEIPFPQRDVWFRNALEKGN